MIKNKYNMDPEALKNLSPAQKEEIMTAVQQQVALANMQVPPSSNYRQLPVLLLFTCD